MVKENLDAEQSKPRWFIDLDWYRQNGRSFATLAHGCLCPRCRERLKAGEDTRQLRRIVDQYRERRKAALVALGSKLAVENVAALR